MVFGPCMLPVQMCIVLGGKVSLTDTSLSVTLGCRVLCETSFPEAGAKLPSWASHPFNSKEMLGCQIGSHHPFLCLR